LGKTPVAADDPQQRTVLSARPTLVTDGSKVTPGFSSAIVELQKRDLFSGSYFIKKMDLICPCAQRNLNKLARLPTGGSGNQKPAAQNVSGCAANSLLVV